VNAPTPVVEATQEPSAEATYDPADSPPAVWPRLVGVCAVLVGLVFVQRPGLVATDSKLDLTVDPWGFLARSLHLWEPTGFFGQVQNQAYGYLMPTGPFFGLAHLLDVTPWVTQRLWWSLLVCAAFVGVERVAAALHIGTPTTRLVAGVVYALSPRMLTVIGPSSVEVLPMALAPWVLLPLVVGSTRGSPRRAAALSAVVVALMGGVNAVATMAALLPAGVFLVTRSLSPRARRLAAWWVGAVAVATAWWVVPLLLLGRYSPPFLDWIESAPVTTSVTSLAASLRGVSDWVAYLPSPAGPDLLAGWQLLSLPVVVVDTMLIAGVGIVGLALPRLGERVWLVACLLVGLVMVTWGHVGPVDGGLAEAARSSLDAALSPFRNTHKFDVAVRLPLVLGLAHGLGWLATALAASDAAGRPRLPAAARLSAVGLGAVVLLGSVAPVLTNRLVPAGAYTDVPGYWSEAAAWVDQHSDGRALVVPGASFGTFGWGRTRDEPLQPLMDTPWGVRDAVPLTPAGTIRALDAVQRRLAAGDGSVGLAPFLARMGVDQLVVRNDLDPVSALAPRPVLVHQALADSPGLRRVAAFGPDVGGGSTPEIRIDDGLDVAYPAVEVWAVDDAQPVVSVAPLDSLLTVAGGPESVLDLSDRGLPADQPVVLAGDSADLGVLLAGSGPVVTDGMRRRETNYGRVDDHSSFTLADSDPLRRDAASRDYLPFDGWETVARWLGVESIGASSSAGDASAPGGSRPADQPSAAMDRDPATAWQSDGGSAATGQWLEVRFLSPVEPEGTLIRVAEGVGPPAARIAVTTDQGRVDQPAFPGRTQKLVTAPGPTRTLRVTLSATRPAATAPGGAFAISELAVPGVVVGHPLDTPGVGTAAFLTSAAGSRSACVSHLGSWLCSPDLAEDGEEAAGIDRVVRLRPNRPYAVRATVLPRPGPALDALLDQRYWGARVTATSSLVSAPQARPQSVLDGSLGSGWVAAADDPDPTLRVQLSEERKVRGIRIRVGSTLASSAPTSVAVEGGDRTVTGDLDDSGALRFRQPLVTDHLVLRFPTVAPVVSHDPRTGYTTRLPVGLSELEVAGASDLLLPAPASDPLLVPCSEGPEVWVGGETVRLSVSTTVGAVLAGESIPAAACSDGEVDPSGRVRVRFPSTPAWLASSVDLADPDAPVLTPRGAPTAAVEVERWGPTTRQVSVAGRTQPSLLLVRENRNPGWSASLGGRVLEPVVVDGWQQAWVLPAGGPGEVELTFRPDTTYRSALAGGALLLALLAVLALVRGRADWRQSRPARPGRLLVLVLGGAALWLVADWWGVLGAAAAVLVVRVVPRRLRLVAGAVAAGAAMAAAAAVLAAHPWGDPAYNGNSALPQAMVVAALALLLAATTWSTEVARSGRNPALEAEDGALEKQPAGGGDGDRPEQGLDEDRPEPT
jgi:arabinofuranan 3-O-arabinosyltransferase